MSQVTFTLYARAEPQGSMKSFHHKTTGAIVSMSSNKRLKPYRMELCRVARAAMRDANLEEPMARTHEPVELYLEFTFLMPKSCRKKRAWPTVPPDLDKLARGVFDALKGVIYADDAQVVLATISKVYGPTEKVNISARTMTEQTSLF